MNKSDLLILLRIHKKSRKLLILDFLKENIEIYGSMFRYEDNKSMMELAISKYFISWFNSNFEIFDGMTNNLSSNPELIKKYSEGMLQLLSTLQSEIKSSDSGNIRMMSSLLLEKKELIEGLYNISEKSEKNYQRILYIKQRDQTLFEREFTKLKKDRL